MDGINVYNIICTIIGVDKKCLIYGKKDAIIWSID